MRYLTGIVERGGRDRVCIVDTARFTEPSYLCAIDTHKTIAEAWARALRFGAKGTPPSHYTLTQKVVVA